MRCIICGAYTANLDYCEDCIEALKAERMENWLEWEQFGGAKYEVH